MNKTNNVNISDLTSRRNAAEDDESEEFPDFYPFGSEEEADAYYEGAEKAARDFNQFLDDHPEYLERLISESEELPEPPLALINYNERFADSSPILFRNEVVKSTLACLIEKYKCCALLVGAAGTGKTKIAEEIARRIACGDKLIPDSLSGSTVMELSLSTLVSGGGLVGGVESAVNEMLDYIKDNNVILFIDEIHQLMSEDQVYKKIAQILKPAMARGNIRIIGATTLQEAQMFLKDPALDRRFQRISVEELSTEQTFEILSSQREALCRHYSDLISVSDETLREIVRQADIYSTAGLHRPDNAITLFDRSMADAYMEYKSLEANECAEAKLLLNVIKDSGYELTPQAVKISAYKLSNSSGREGSDAASLRKALETIKGQDNIMEDVVNYIKRSSLNLRPQKRPLSFLFAGPSGVGKTETARILAREINGGKPIILNMSEFYDDASINRLIGSPAGYVESDSNAELPFDILETNPCQVILLDEFEKCHRKVQRLFMSALDEGYFQNSHGRVIDFSKCIIIATTNAAHTDRRSSRLGFGTAEELRNKVTVKDYSGSFDIELLNRFTAIFEFNPINKETFSAILADQYRKMAQEVSENPEYAFLPKEMPADDVKRLADKNYVPEFGARPCERLVTTYIEDMIFAVTK